MPNRFCFFFFNFPPTEVATCSPRLPIFKNSREVNTVGTLTFKLLTLLSESFFLGVFSAFSSLSITTQKITFSAWNGDGQTSRRGGSLSRQSAGFEKAGRLNSTRTTTNNKLDITMNSLLSSC